MTDKKDERERTTYYEAHKDDPDEWGTPLSPKPRRRLASMFSVRLAPQELALVRSAAEERGLSVSSFLRMAALKEAQAPAAGFTGFVGGLTFGMVNHAVAATPMSFSVAVGEPREAIVSTGIVWE